MTNTHDEIGKHFFKVLSALAANGSLEIYNARGEFACNSSSSHSILIVPETISKSEAYNTHSQFLLLDSTDKIRYLAASLLYRDHEEESQQILDLSGQVLDFKEFDDLDVSPSYPTDKFDTLPVEFLKDLISLFSRDDVVIAGGNDYDYIEDNEPFVSMKQPFVYLHFLTSRYTIRKDTVNGDSWWVLFDKYDGTKLRLNFEAKALDAAPIKAQTPELVDVKVTDRCPYELDCGFCYMGSTRQGAEADPEKVMNLITSLSHQNVFEIAFGGGEPTLWAPFETILHHCKNVGVIPNFTTKNYNVFKFHPEWVDLIGAVAFSVNDEQGFTKLKKALDGQYFGRKVSLQIIPEIIEDDLLDEIFDYCKENHYRLTLLGYKLTGRGGEFDGRIKRPESFWMDKVKETKDTYLRLSIDTTLASNSAKTLEDNEVPSWSYDVYEGNFSMYVDAVNEKCAPSSYIEPSDMDSISLSADSETLTSALEERFKTY